MQKQIRNGARSWHTREGNGTVGREWERGADDIDKEAHDDTTIPVAILAQG